MSKLAYHSVVHALEAKAGLNKQARFALAIQHAVNGHLPYERLVHAGRKYEQNGGGKIALEAALKDWLATDLCPSAQLIRLLDSETALLAFFNEYDHALGNAVVTTLVTDTSLGLKKHRIVRSVPAHNKDPAACHAAGLMKAEILLGQVQGRKSSNSRPLHVTKVTELAQFLGVEKSTGFEVAHYFELHLSATVSDLAKALGTHPRTLARQLKQEGLSANNIRRTCMLGKAVQSLPESKTLGEVSKDCAYADQAHMSRAFRSACGLSPNILKKLIVL